MELTIRLRARRKQLGLPITDLSKHLEFSSNYYSAVENGRTLLAADKLAELSRRLEFSKSEAEELQALREIAREPRWTAEFAKVINDDLALYYGLEYGASRVRSYEGCIVPGLLQSDDYATALFRDDPDTPGTRVQLRLDLRRRRRARLFDDDPLTVDLLLGQAVIMQQIGGAEVLRNQLLHLLDLIDRLDTTLHLRILPFESSPRGMVNAATIHLLEFASPHLPLLAWREAVTPVGISDDTDLLDLLEVNFERAADSALSRDASFDLLRGRVTELEKGPG